MSQFVSYSGWKVDDGPNARHWDFESTLRTSMEFFGVLHSLFMRRLVQLTRSSISRDHCPVIGDTPARVRSFVIDKENHVSKVDHFSISTDVVPRLP